MVSIHASKAFCSDESAKMVREMFLPEITHLKASREPLNKPS